MTIDILIIKIILIAYPGILILKINEHISGKREDSSTFDNIMLIFLFSIFSYIIHDAIIQILPVGYLNVLELDGVSLSYLLNGLIGSDTFQFNYYSIIILTIISVIIAYLGVLITSKRLLNKVAVKLKLTKRESPNDVWDIFHDTHKDWVVVRDLRREMYYFGYVDRFSDNSDIRELLLTDVSVYSDSGEFKYEVREKYFARDKYELDIEIFDYTKKEDEINVGESAK